MALLKLGTLIFIMYFVYSQTCVNFYVICCCIHFVPLRCHISTQCFCHSAVKNEKECTAFRILVILSFSIHVMSELFWPNHLPLVPSRVKFKRSMDFRFYKVLLNILSFVVFICKWTHFVPCVFAYI